MWNFIVALLFPVILVNIFKTHNDSICQLNCNYMKKLQLLIEVGWELDYRHMTATIFF